MYLRALRNVRFINPSLVLSVSRMASTQVADPIQRAFVQQIQEYSKKRNPKQMGLADASQQELKEMNDMLAKIDRIFGAEGQDMTQFPSFNFSEPQLNYPRSSVSAPLPSQVATDVKAEEKVKDERYVLVI
ncbi:unnamed protein product [Calicophoron daubneyi]|uniref:ATP synthase-coupling factor 6, mitochondrial n=1 Tax=Calicophoron daubneyi TaxID=300641 RepID=A0AAV2SZA5_CALDB